RRNRTIVSGATLIGRLSVTLRPPGAAGHLVARPGATSWRGHSGPRKAFCSLPPRTPDYANFGAFLAVGPAKTVSREPVSWLGGVGRREASNGSPGRCFDPRSHAQSCDASRAEHRAHRHRCIRGRVQRTEQRDAGDRPRRARHLAAGLAESGKLGARALARWG